jgi:hypothetical protein
VTFVDDGDFNSNRSLREKKKKKGEKTIEKEQDVKEATQRTREMG